MTTAEPASEPDFAASRTLLEAALDDPALQTEVHYLLWEICQACGDPEAARAHLDAAIARNPVRTRLLEGAVPVRSVLAIMTPGDFQANLPLSMLLGASTALHTLWIGDARAALDSPTAALPAGLPRFDCVFIAVSEDSRHGLALQAADALAAALGSPTINRGSGIAALSRDGAARLLADVPGAVVPAQRLTDCAALRTAGLSFPLIIRPQASHAGRGLSRIDNPAALDAYLAGAAPATRFYVAPFVDFRSADGMFRKYRIVLVDRVPYPVHLAIHDDWAIWYYNARMDSAAWKRAEEECFMADMASSFGTQAMDALREIGRRIDLDYVGVDCALMPDGSLVVFEVETGMIVHDHDPVDLFAYKKIFVPRIFAAVERMIDGRIAAARSSACGADPSRTAEDTTLGVATTLPRPRIPGARPEAALLPKRSRDSAASY